MAFTIFPVIIASKDEMKNKVLMNHESIHLKQQKELLVIFFLLLYYAHSMYFLIRYLSLKKAYRLNFFEVEAFVFEDDIYYLNTRKWFSSFRSDSKKDDYISQYKKEKVTASDRVGAIAIILSLIFVAGLITVAIIN